MPLLNSIKELYEEKSSILDSEIGEIHPIYEALAKLLKDQVTDQKALEYLKKSEKEGLKSIIVADVFLEKVKNHAKKDELRKMLDNGESLEDIIERASLYLSENKRIHENNILYRPNILPEEIKKYVDRRTKRLTRIYPGSIYLQKEVIDYFKANKRKFKRNRIIKYIVLGVAGLGLTVSGLAFSKQYDIKIIPKQSQRLNIYE